MLKTNGCVCILWASLQTAITAQNMDLGTLKGQIQERVQAKPLEINGGISLNTVTTVGTQPNPQPFTYVASGNLLFKIKNYDLPFSFTYTNRKWNYQNPTFKFNYTSFQPKYKQWQAHFGDISMNLSPYTLVGFQMQGVGLTYTPVSILVIMEKALENKNLSQYLCLFLWLFFNRTIEKLPNLPAGNLLSTAQS